MQTLQQQIVEHYVNSYNSFDVAGMLKNLDQEIIFENMSNGVVNLRTDGIKDFRIQAEAATQYFKERTQKIVSWTYSDTTVTIMIDYKAILNMDLPNGMKNRDTRFFMPLGLSLIHISEPTRPY